MPIHERLSMVVSLILIGLALYFVIDLPTQIIPITIFTWSTSISISVNMVMTLLLAGMSFTGCGAIVRAYPDKQTHYVKPFWVNATLLVILASIILTQLPTTQLWVVGLVLSGILLWLTILAAYYTVEKSDLYFYVAQLWSQGMSYTLLLAYTVLIYQSEMGLWLKLMAFFVVTWFLAASVFDLRARYTEQPNPFPFLIAVGLTQLVWVLSYWDITTTRVALLGLLLFYSLCGVINAHFDNVLSKRVLLEYGLVACIGFSVVQLMVN